MLDDTTPHGAAPIDLAVHHEMMPLSDVVRQVLAAGDLDGFVRRDPHFYSHVMARLTHSLQRAFGEGCDAARFQVHRGLYYLYEENLREPRPGEGLNQFHPFVIRVRNEIEQAWEAFEQSRLDCLKVAIPEEVEAFAAYFEERCFGHKLWTHPLFDFLEEQATRDEMVDFFLHEGTLVLRFCDLVVLSMVGAGDDVRRELASNFWDEVGGGEFQNRHTELYKRLLRHAGIDLATGSGLSDALMEKLGWQGLSGYNLYLNFALHRRNYFKSVGALGAGEMMDPPQYVRIVRGCHRVGLGDPEAIAYYSGHGEMDVSHGEAWLTGVVNPLIRRHPETRRDIMAGALLRIQATADYYDALFAKLTRRNEQTDSPYSAVSLSRAAAVGS